ncbi:MAG: FAD-dependent oxidoreductase [Coriobacteriales bacterium]|nr:FAD-dependent oxidoreductase [Coriobacteriales bacterium]
MSEISRKTFLKSSVIGAAGLALGALVGCSEAGKGSTDATPTAANWDREADVVICGAGGTGLAAACSSAEAGASVLVFEKDSKPGGTTALSGGVIQAAGTRWQKEFTSFSDDTPDRHAECYLKQAEGIGDEELIRSLCTGVPEDVEWLSAIGINFVKVYGNCHVPYAEELHADRIHVYEGGGGIGQGGVLTDAEYAEAQRLGATFEFSSEVLHLVYDAENGVSGIIVSVGGAEQRVKANKGVILALGGIDRNLELAKALNQQQYWDLTTQQSMISEFASGDGIRMGLEIGAALATVGGTIDFDLATGQATDNSLPQLPCVTINASGKRFVCEDATYAYQYRAIFQQMTQLDGPTWMILDQNMVEQGVGPWAADVDAAVTDGILIKADTYEALAEALGISATNFVNTMTLWNENVEKHGADLEFGRNTQLIKLDKPPFYAHLNVSANLGSLGGLKIDSNAQVYDLTGKPIPHLYAGGMNSGGWYGLYYPGSGTSLSGGLHFGRVAGRSAANA